MAELSAQERAALKATGQSLEAAFQVGKNGLTEGVVKELQTHLSRAPLVKVKLVKGAMADASAKDLAAELASQARVHLVEVRGHTALFYRFPRHKRGADEF